jgi:hypothetical protein
MHWHKTVPSILLILSLINFLLAAPVVLRELRRDEYSDEPWQKRGQSLGPSPALSVEEPPADQELAANSPPSPQTGTSRIQDAASVSSPPEIDSERPPSIELASNMGGPPPSDGPGPDLASNEGMAFWDPNDWSSSSSEPEPKKDFISRLFSCFGELAGKLKFWRRTSKSVSA